MVDCSSQKAIVHVDLSSAHSTLQKKKSRSLFSALQSASFRLQIPFLFNTHTAHTQLTHLMLKNLGRFKQVGNKQKVYTLTQWGLVSHLVDWRAVGCCQTYFANRGHSTTRRPNRAMARWVRTHVPKCQAFLRAIVQA